ncbi:MAG: UDP-N-acetylmuramoyl-L-alanyl-D-glutamate--2,6-diaminopimelate ligase [Candidatus Magnetoglobus multicellularis str. Araruama]|uniref:UDP-N-acetylmuramoyl-L-alanyl-D-glutamate--2,6-diaminopimelate ligase n=1 Tax=Candidatus Magnetoglobus multicellularis str. Araruama TaxID=890399 RepID=A0A1V1P8I0_9BACT|nr:MAG: UDP-N-acetylmuramoyl-L-alanyl-D-glutamate--2,6-diaminopimelate ligase [Candidatus Magnetoglobus multicellularis str. Araruama]
MKLSQLLEAFPEYQGIKNDTQVTGLHYDSRKIEPDNIFVAIRGHKTDGHNYISQAIENGACAVVAESESNIQSKAIWIRVANSRQALANLANKYFGNPSNKLCLIGITGTNGKTTTAYLVENILKANGLSTGVISTIDYRYHDRAFPNPLTTPESLDLQRILHEMTSNGITHVVMEVSSHSLALDRVMGCAYDVVVFTNLSQDHLDFHETMNDYWHCKQCLFGPPYISQKQHAHAVINCDNKFGLALYPKVQIPQILIGTHETNDVSCQDPKISLSGMSGSIETPKGPVSLKSFLTGQHNLQNILCATGVGIALEIPIADISSGISQTSCIPGRLERLTAFSDRFVFVDYAHTPDALENVIQCILQFKTRRLITVFGCGGDRDRGKRPLMGKVASSLSDLCIVTSDNPRSEPPEAIIHDICKGINSDALYKIEIDRKKAIEMAIHESCSGDVVLIAGKGHETYQILKDRTIEFDDRACALSVR